MQTLTFHISGMHCSSCERLTESELSEVAGVTAVTASLAKATVQVTGDFDGQSADVVLRQLSPLVQKHGFTLSAEPLRPDINWAEFGVAIPLALALMAVFLLAQKLGVGRQIDFTHMGYGVAFLVGVVASLSSCMAIVGGLVLSLSAYYAQQGEKMRPQILFHVGRLGAFFLLGGIAGAAGSIFHIGDFGAMVLGLLVGGIMVVMGLSLLNIFHWPKRMQVKLPKSVGERVHALSGPRTWFMPVLVGGATFFLPCGFTQSMQLYTLTTGSFSTGALTMFCFALGTFPVLALLSFSPLGTQGREKSGIFFKTAGLLVALFGIYDILGSLASYGIIPPILAF